MFKNKTNVFQSYVSLNKHDIQKAKILNKLSRSDLVT